MSKFLIKIFSILFLNVKFKIQSFQTPMECQPQKQYPFDFKYKNAPVKVYYYSEISEEQVKLSLDSVPFKEWLENLEKQPNINLSSLTIQNVDMFGPRIGFIKFKGEVTKSISANEKKPIPNIVFMRGGSVAILVVLKEKATQKKYTLLTKQARFPIGVDMFAEVPAGMLDGNGDFKGVAAKEMEEETGLHIKQNELIDLTEFAFQGKSKGLFLSPGGCDEFIRIFAYEKEVEQEFIKSLKGKLTGEHGSDEVIILDICELDELWRKTPDAKTLSALFLYQKYLAEKGN